MSVQRPGRLRFAAALALLVAMHFYVRPRLWDGRAAPDFLVLALLFFAMRNRPGVAAAAGFVVGIVADSLTPARFGAGALAHTVVAYVAAWGRAVFFPDNLLVNAGLVAAGVWIRNAIVLLASGTALAQLRTDLLVWAPVQAATTALAGVAAMLALRSWLDFRLDA